MAILFDIDPTKTNEIAINFANNLAKSVETICFEPTQKIYFHLLNTWSGYAAQAYLPKISIISSNFYNINKSLISIGRSIHNIVDYVVNADMNSGGKLTQIENVVGKPIDNPNYKPTSDVEDNIMTVADDFDSNVLSLSTIVFEIDKLKTDIDVEKTNLVTFWKTGTERSTIIEAIDSLIINIGVFQNEANQLIEELTKSKQILLEKANGTSSGGGGGGSADNKLICSHCNFLNSQGSSVCASCGKAL